MNLSKVHSSGNAFEPEDLVARRLDEGAVFGSIIVDRLPPESAEDEAKPPPRDSAFSQDNEQPSPREDQARKEKASEQPKEAEEVVGSGPEETDMQTVEQASPPEAEQPDPAPLPPEPEMSTTPSPEAEVEESIVQPPEELSSPPPQPQITPDDTEQLLNEVYEKGVQEGLQLAEQDFGSATQSLLQSCKQLDSLRETILRNSVGDMQALVLAIAEKIIRKSVQEQSDTVLLTVEEAIQKAVKSDELKVYVNPEDYEVVEQKAQQLMQSLSGLNNLTVKKDKNIERGGCRVESDNCTVDATLLSQLEIVQEQLDTQ